MKRWRLHLLLVFVFVLTLARTPLAAPWAEVGDDVLRGDIENLYLYGLIRGPITAWPIPWGQISVNLPGEEERAGLPPHVQKSLKRVTARLRRETETGRIRSQLVARASNEPALVRGFRSTARNELDTRIQAEYMGDHFAARLSFGDLANLDLSSNRAAFDDSYAALRLGNWLLYGGVFDKWWGPGQVSSLQFSNNARPFPKIGATRYNPTAFDLPVLRWLGPWQVDAFVGVLDDDRFISNPLEIGWRISINPYPGLELAVSYLVTDCGDGPGADCNLFASLSGKDNAFGNVSNGVGGADIRYSSSLLGQPFAIYGQITGEDQGTIVEPLTGVGVENASILYGMTLWNGIGPDGGLWRLTAEYADTKIILHDTGPYNIMYEHNIYRSGYRYRGRALGFSLDNDSDLISLVGTLTDIRDWTYRLAYHHARINRDGTTRTGFPGEPLSTSAETINIIEAGLTVPWRRGDFDIMLRLQDDDVNSPNESDYVVGIELGLSLSF